MKVEKMFEMLETTLVMVERYLVTNVTFAFNLMIQLMIKHAFILSC